MVLVGRLFYLQVVEGEKYIRFSKRQFQKEIQLLSARGKIYDRNYQLLVNNKLRIDLTVTPQYVEDKKQLLRVLSEITEKPIEYLMKKYKKLSYRASPFTSFSLIEDVGFEVASLVETFDKDLSGVQIEAKFKRFYENKQFFSQSLGFMNEINRDELKKFNKEDSQYQLGDLVGRGGLEKKWEKILKGKNGFEYVEVDARGRLIGGLKEKRSQHFGYQEFKEPTPGHNLVLTIDAGLQKIAEEQLKERIGAVVALDPNSGQILALASSPSFDANLLQGQDRKYFVERLKNPWGAFRNKAIHDHFPPASTFKPFIALAALENKIITPKQKIKCGPTFKLGRRRYHEHIKGGYGNIDLDRAMAVSSNVYFWTLANQLSIDKIKDTAESFGFGQKTGIDLYNEVRGFVPSLKWAKEVRKNKWQRGETLSVAIGQGVNLVTPLQLAIAYSAFANGGNMYQPYVLSRIEDPKGLLVKQFDPLLKKKLNFNIDNLNVVKNTLRSVVEGGTARILRSIDMPIAGKTGTAQVKSFDKKQLFSKCHLKPLKYRHHGWFAGFAPFDKPDIVITALSIHGCSSRDALAISKPMFQYWSDQKKVKQAAAINR